MFWASGVLLTAYCSVPSRNEQGTADEIAALVTASQNKDGTRPVHANPWAKGAN